MLKLYCEDCGHILNLEKDIYVCPYCGAEYVETTEDDWTPHPIKDFVGWASFAVFIAMLWILCFGAGCK